MSTSSSLFEPSRQTFGFAVLRGVAGALLLTAALLKAHQLLTGPALGSYWWDARPWQSLAIGGEFLIAGWMWSGLFPRVTRGLGLTVFGVFSVVTLIKALGGEDSCGCFGQLTVNPWITLGLDVGLFAGFTLIRPVPKFSGEVFDDDSANQRGSIPGISLAILVFAAIAGIGLGAWTMNAEPAQLQAETGELLGDGEFVVLEPEQWVGHGFPLFDYSDLPDELRRGNWWVMLYSHTCGHCMETISKIDAVARNGQPVALLSMPPHADRDVPFDSGVSGRLNNTRDWFAQTPVLVELTDGIVVRAVNGPQADDWF